MKEGLSSEIMARRIGLEIEDGFYVNLGIGLPTLVAHHINPDRFVLFQSENGILGMGPHAKENEIDDDLGNAGGEDVTIIPGASFFDSSVSFSMIRGGHINVTVLGGFQVSKKGDLANWKIPSRKIGSCGGAMDLAVGARKVIVMMKHVTKDGEPRIVNKCLYPLTAKECVNMIVTDIAVIDVSKNGLVLREIAPEWSVEEVQDLTEAKLDVSNVSEWKV